MANRIGRHQSSDAYRWHRNTRPHSATWTAPLSLSIMRCERRADFLQGWLADAVGRRQSVTVGCAIFTVGVIVQAATPNHGKDYILAGRFVTGIGVGAYSMLVPLYNAELAPPETRGALVALQQLAITFGIMISYWIGYGTNFIGGTGASQSEAAWLIPICIQLLPSTVLAAGMLMFAPESPRHLMNRGREEECLTTLARLRSASPDDMKVRIEFLEIKALREFERLRSAEKYPQLQDGSLSSNFKIGYNEYLSVSAQHRTRSRTSREHVLTESCS